MRCILFTSALAIAAPFVVVPAKAQSVPSQTQLDGWTEDIVRYCTPEIRRFIRVGLEDARKRVADQNRNRNGGVQWRYDEGTERENLRSAIEQSLSWAIEMPAYAPGIDEIYAKGSGGMMQRGVDGAASAQARRDMDYCFRSRMLTLEYPAYRRW